MNFLNQLKEFAIDRDEPFQRSQCVANFLWCPRRKDHAHHRLGRTFHHGLALFVETGDDGIVLFEGDEQGGQRWIVVVPGFEIIPGLFEWHPGEPLNPPQTFNP
jgi:hypothetical protein